MTWFDRRICTLAEAQRKGLGDSPGFLDLGDRAKLWLEDRRHHNPQVLDCWVVGYQASFGRIYYDLALPLGDSGLCAVIPQIYAGWVTSCDATEAPLSPEGVEITPLFEASLRRDGMRVVRSEADHAAQAGARLPSPAEDRLLRDAVLASSKVVALGQLVDARHLKLVPPTEQNSDT